MSTGRKFVSDVFVRMAFQVLNALKGLIYLPLIARLFGTTGYSIWSQIFLTVTLLAPLMTLRLNAALARYMGGLDRGAERSRTFFSAIVPLWIVSAVVLTTGLAAQNGLAFLLFADSTQTGFALVFSFLLVVRVNFSFVSSYYRSISKIRLYTTIQTLQIVLEIAALYSISLRFGQGLQEVLWGFLAIELALTVGMLIDIVRRDGLPRRLSRETLRRLLRFSLPLVPAAAMYWVVNSSDRYVIVHLVGLDEAGVYSAAYRVAQILKLMLQPISFVLLPLVAGFWERGKQEQARLYLSRSTFWFLILAIPATAGLVSLGPEILTTLGTADFLVSRGLIALLAVGELCVGVYQIYVYIIYLFEKTWIQPVLFSVLALLNLGLNLVLVPRMGILGAATTTLGAYFLQAAFVVIYTDRLFHLPVDRKKLCKAVLGGASVYLATRYVPGSGPVHLVVAILVGIAVYVTLMLITRAVSLSELRSAARAKTRDDDT